jgi:DNA-binding beta-propeller fold protein YncE
MGRFSLPARRTLQRTILAALLSTLAQGAWAQPTFVNGLVIPGDSLDATERFRIGDTIIFTDPDRLLTAPTAQVNRRRALNGLNPLGLNNDAGSLGRSFDPEGLVIDPRTGHLIVADEYGPSVYEFDRQGRLLQVFVIPDNLIPKLGGVPNFIAIRDDCTTSPPLCTGRQDNRGFEGLAIAPDGTKVYAVLQDPLINEGPHSASAADVNGRDGRNLRVVVFDNDPDSSTYLTSIAQYAYQLELQADVAARIATLKGTSSPTDPRQGRNIGFQRSPPSTTTNSWFSSATIVASASTTRRAPAWSARSGSTRSILTALPTLQRWICRTMATSQLPASCR